MYVCIYRERYIYIEMREKDDVSISLSLSIHIYIYVTFRSGFSLQLSDGLSVVYFQWKCTVCDVSGAYNHVMHNRHKHIYIYIYIYMSHMYVCPVSMAVGPPHVPGLRRPATRAAPAVDPHRRLPSSSFGQLRNLSSYDVDSMRVSNHISCLTIE